MCHGVHHPVPTSPGCRGRTPGGYVCIDSCRSGASSRLAPAKRRYRKHPVAFAFASFVAGLVAWFRSAKLVTTKMGSPALAVLGLEVVGAAGLSFVGFVHGFHARRGGASHIAIRHSAYLTGLAAKVGVVAALVLTLVWLIEGFRPRRRDELGTLGSQRAGYCSSHTPAGRRESIRRMWAGQPTGSRRAISPGRLHPSWAKNRRAGSFFGPS